MFPSLVRVRLRFLVARQAVNLLAVCAGWLIACGLPLASSGWNVANPGHAGTTQTHGALIRVAEQSAPITLVIGDEAELDLGVVPQGGFAESFFSLTNPRHEPVEITEIRTSCECLRIELPYHALGPSAKVAGQLLLDLTSKPEFAGNLEVDVRGLTSAGEVAFMVVVNVKVGRARELGTGGQEAHE